MPKVTPITILINVFNSIVLLSLIFYFPYVFLNLVFTHETLTPSDVPYYDPLITTARSDRYEYEWYFTALDTMRIIPPCMLLFTLLYFVIYGESYLILYTLVIIVCILVELMNLIKRTVAYVDCSNWQICRNFDPTGDPGKPNTVFLVMFWYNLAFLIIDIIYGLILYAFGDLERLVSFEKPSKRE
jgi:hypothetical protein